MKDKIKRYIEYLINDHGFKISLHGEGILPHLDFLAPYNAHECAYCMYVKSSDECRRRCKLGQSRAQAALSESDGFFGSCYAGVGEFVFPIKAFDSVVGMISVGGYAGSVEKRGAFAVKYGFRDSKLHSLADESLSSDIPDISLVRTLIDPLSCMLTLFIERMGGVGCENLYGKILSILHTGYMRKIKISDIAAECHYSASFISRYFKEKSKRTVNEYLFFLRMEKAGDLICNSDMRIEDVSASVGFSDANYFISCFSNHFGISPKKYRNVNKK